MTGWTKEQVIDQAFDALGLGRYKFDLPVELQQSALRFFRGPPTVVKCPRNWFYLTGQPRE